MTLLLVFFFLPWNDLFPFSLNFTDKSTKIWKTYDSSVQYTIPFFQFMRIVCMYDKCLIFNVGCLFAWFSMWNVFYSFSFFYFSVTFIFFLFICNLFINDACMNICFVCVCAFSCMYLFNWRVTWMWQNWLPHKFLLTK